MSDLFLTHADVDELTGIRGGKKGQPKFVRQVDQLRRMGIPFHVNAAGRPIVARVAIEGGPKTQAKEPNGWTPAVLTRAA